MRICRSLFGILVLLVFVGAAATPVEAQDLDFVVSPHWAVGYVVNAPTQLVGFSGTTFGPHLADWGVYVDAKFTLDSPEGNSNFNSSLTPEEVEELWGDTNFDTEGIWTTVNVALVRVLSEALALYVGAGYSHEDAYILYYDETGERGELGWYWVKDDSASGDRVNLMGGAWMRLVPRVIVQFGGETAPAGFTVGAAIVLPFGR
ncbi:MAG: hypothetical protein JSV86_03010 [Gemmatimonadota bacterium]|nr:MAG: hypothetical protein JSV86_03010 [Gemmatimonadota bacterium]